MSYQVLSPSPTQCWVYDAMSQEQCHNLTSIDIIATELFNQPLTAALHSNAVIIPKKINKLYCNVVSGLLPIYILKCGQLALSFNCIVIENIRIDDPKNILPLLLEQKYF